MNTYVTVYFGTVLMAMFLVPAMSRLARKYRLVDVPGPRKVHKAVVPRIGGIAFVVPTLALVLPLFFLHNSIGQSFRQMRMELSVLLAAAVFVLIVGLIDDLRSVPGYVKLLCLVAASLAVCASGATVRSFSLGSWLEVETGWLAWPLTVFWITAITVCMNFIDGLDGLAAGIAAMVCGMIALLAYLDDQVAMVVLMLALLGSVTGFLFFNFHPAKIFMGDSGSMFLGFVIGASSIACQAKKPTLVGLALPLLVLGVPIVDTGLAFVRRGVLERRSMFSADRKHLHHRLLDLGLSHRAVVLTIYAVTAINTSIGVLMLTTERDRPMVLLVGGLLLLLSMFAWVHGSRHCEILMALKHNLAMAQEARAVRRSFENAEVRMHDVESFPAWWETVCEMARQMHFRSIGLWNRCNGRFVSTCEWNTPDTQAAGGRAVQLNLPLRGNGTVQWEIRACIGVEGYLELSGREVMLLARLMDEFPLPEQQAMTMPADASMRCGDPRAMESEEPDCGDCR
jgi:UDP-GlcNAc:undecaprenyl-phosphate GlcNAc-1-phosphate transferase